MALYSPAVLRSTKRAIDYGKSLNEPHLRSACFSFNLFDYNCSATDCLNGTLLKDTVLPKPFMNFTQFWKIYNESKTAVDPTNKYAHFLLLICSIALLNSFTLFSRILPTQKSLTIFNTSQLFINLEGCVNSLKGECLDFLHVFGRDGENNTAQSRYPCFYNKVIMLCVAHDD